MNDWASSLADRPRAEADELAALFSVERQARAALGANTGAESGDPVTILMDRWCDSDWFRQWETLAYAGLGPA